MSPGVPASIKARLLRQARQKGEEFELYLVRYASERLLYRLGASAFRDRFVLKGAGLLTLWMDDPYRATRDLDFLAFEMGDGTTIEEAVRSVCAVPCPEDGLMFDTDQLEVSRIRADEEFEGQRVVLRAYLGKARVRVQVDFGFGESIAPGPEESEYPTLLDGLPAPWVRTYPREVAIAEKFEAMVQLGQRNSRMKDFHDVWALSSEFAFDGPRLRRAVSSCFEQRGIECGKEMPDALRPAFYDGADLRARWKAYLRASAFRAPPPELFAVVGDRVREFLGPVWNGIAARTPHARHWSPSGPWHGAQY